MNIINNTGDTLEFMYGDEEVFLAPGEIFPIDGFNVEKLEDISTLVNLGFVTFFDDEEEEPDLIIPYELRNNVEQAKNRIVDKSGGRFKKLDFNNTELD